MSGYVFTPRARQGLWRVVSAVEERFGRSVSAEVLARLEACFERIATHPGAGHVRHDITEAPGIAFWSVGPTLIAYRQDTDPVQILFVERGELDWAHLMLE